MDAKNREGRTPVHLASTIRWLGSFAGAEAGLEKLIEAGADISVRTITDNTALHIAADIGCEGVARALVKAGADVDAKNGQGLTPLLVAAGSGGVRRTRKRRMQTAGGGEAGALLAPL